MILLHFFEMKFIIIVGTNTHTLTHKRTQCVVAAIFIREYPLSRTRFLPIACVLKMLENGIEMLLLLLLLLLMLLLLLLLLLPHHLFFGSWHTIWSSCVVMNAFDELVEIFHLTVNMSFVATQHRLPLWCTHTNANNPNKCDSNLCEREKWRRQRQK